MPANNTTPPEPLAVSPKQATQLVPIGITKLYEAINNGRIESTLVNGRRWINYQSLKRLAGVSHEATPADWRREREGAA
jgi:hypothetical protein